MLNRLKSLTLLMAVVLFVQGVAIVRAAPVAAPVGERLQYNRDIRPILSENCFLCHGPDKNARKSGLRLDIAEEAVRPAKSGKVAIVPGKPAESEVLRRLTTTDADDLMPPPESHKQVTVEQRERLRRWIAEGAVYQPHWAYIVPKRPALPAGAERRNPVDAFVDARLAAQQLKRSGEADRVTLLRRVSLDLTGIPPTPAEVELFVHDRSANAYERQVERLLRSPHHGERMAVPWLDLVRFADTVGYHGDQNIDVFPYRDYVIDAFNRNLSFDRFTREQLAGDLLPGATDEQRVATAFNRLNMVTREGGAQPREYLSKYAADRVRTVAMTWLGSTMGCCECHDHKFDPFTSRDFYSMEAFFADVKQWGVYNDYDYTPNPDLKGWSNDHPFPPEIEVGSPYLQHRAARLSAALDVITTRASCTSIRGDAANAFEQWRRNLQTYLKRHPDGWATPVPVVEGKSTPVTNINDGIVVVIGDGKQRVGDAILSVPLSELDGAWIAAVRLELLPDGTNTVTVGGISTRLNPGFQWVEGTASGTVLTFHHADANLSEPRYANGYPFIGIREGWKTSGKRSAERHAGVWVLESPRRVTRDSVLRVTVKTDVIQRFRISVTPLADANPLASGNRVEWAAALRPGSTLAPDRAASVLATPYLLGTDEAPAERREWQQVHRQWLECRNGRAPIVVTAAWKPATVRVLPRGNWQDESGEVVPASPPRFLGRNGLPELKTLNRLDLADWLVSPDNPLTARVFVNRLWKQFFGTGLSAQVDDLGAQGEWPTHPELLDWLAVEFRESGWDMRHLIRLIVTSGTYRQCANLRPELHDRDPNNRWLASQNPRRLEAEFVRDNALFIAGLLDPEIGGPSAFPYQPANYYLNIQFPDRDYHSSPTDRQYRRGLYNHWQRTFLHPMLANFDAPSREECTATRTVSNTPQQALTLLNDPTFVEASRALAQRLLAGTERTDVERIRRAYRLAVAREPRPAELDSLNRFLQEQRSGYAQQPADAGRFIAIGQWPVSATPPVELAAWTQVARVILNLHETLTRY